MNLSPIDHLVITSYLLFARANPTASKGWKTNFQFVASGQNTVFGAYADVTTWEVVFPRANPTSWKWRKTNFQFVNHLFPSKKRAGSSSSLTDQGLYP